MKKGLYFHFHIDAAYVGYYCSLLRENHADHWVSLPKHTIRQMEVVNQADSITIDPHKSGYMPFCIGSVLHKNNKLKNQINFIGTYNYDGKSPNLSRNGIEGSRSGFTPVGAYLAHTVLPLNRENHGELL